jgi:C_GCAxxG_C_C family probable redox protein
MNLNAEITNKQKLALESFKNGFNCSQSVLSVFAEELNLKKDTALKLATPFGAGMAYMQETCGAVTGALMAIGLKYGKGEFGTNEDKTHAYNQSKQFIAEFRKKNQSVCCRNLLDGIDMNTPEGMARIVEFDYFRTRCCDYVADAVQIAEEILNRDK